MSHDLGIVTIFRFFEVRLGSGLGLRLGFWLGLKYKKSKNRNNPKNVTGIRLIIDQLLRDNNFLYRYQSGFRRHHLTETALINIYDRLMNINKSGPK